MAQGDFKRVAATMATATTLTSHIDLGKTYQHVYLDVPTMATATAIYIHASEALGGSYRKLTHAPINSATAAVNDYEILTAAASNRMIPIPNGHRFLKIEIKTAVSNNATAFNVVCGD
jgi:hypothetical protein